jgi:hypothetical protein
MFITWYGPTASAAAYGGGPSGSATAPEPKVPRVAITTSTKDEVFTRAPPDRRKRYDIAAGFIGYHR